MSVYDLVIVGAGPAGLAASIAAKGHGLRHVVLEKGAIVNTILHFPLQMVFFTTPELLEIGNLPFVTPYEKPTRAEALRYYRRVVDAFELPIEMGQTVSSVTRHGEHLVVATTSAAGEQTWTTRTVIIATGARYRKPSLANVERFEGAGVYYSATFMEAQLCAGDEIIVVGGANSAGQAAVFLSRTASRIHLLVRSDNLSASMSRYLVRRIEEIPTIQVRTQTEIVALEGDGHLESVQWRDHTGALTSHDISHVFLMTGAEANTGWLNGRVTLDRKGFIKTGPDLTQQDLAAAQWPLERAPYLLETSRPGVFAVGDVRCGNIKRVASAVGEGSIAISFVHRVLAE